MVELLNEEGILDLDANYSLSKSVPPVNAFLVLNFVAVLWGKNQLISFERVEILPLPIFIFYALPSTSYCRNIARRL